MVSTAVAVLVAVTALPLAAAATTNTTYPLFAIANNPVAADWTLADIVGTARDFTLADGVPVDAGLLSQLNQVSQRTTTAASQWYHHSITVVSQWHSSGAVLSAPARQNFSKYKKYRCDAVVMQW